MKMKIFNGIPKMSINGYVISYNDFWKVFQVSHPKIGCRIAEFDTEAEAKEFCLKG